MQKTNWPPRLLGALLSGVVGVALLVGIEGCDSANPIQTAKAREVSAVSRPFALAAFNGRVVGITDGDTIKVLVGGQEQRIIRFAEIDAPEKSQPWGNRSKQALADLISGRDVEVRPTDTDRYGRTVAHVLLDGRDINRQMVELGAAWAFRQYLVDRSLIDVEARAKQQGVGLWSMPDNEVIAPWEWRRGVRVAPIGAAADSNPGTRRSLLATSEPADGSGSLSCGLKTRCREMTSCAEANFYLRQCGVSSLDGDSDGEPCEVLCGTARR